jgi:murein DD-endopeptidase MepM/ murein hydrolase activator NlpD
MNDRSFVPTPSDFEQEFVFEVRGPRRGRAFARPARRRPPRPPRPRLPRRPRFPVRGRRLPWPAGAIFNLGLDEPVAQPEPEPTAYSPDTAEPEPEPSAGEPDASEWEVPAPVRTAQPEPKKTEVPFAPLPPPGSYWPVRTSHPQARLVSYRTIGGKIVGWPGRVFKAARKGKRNGVITARNHAGIDLFARPGDAVIACENGKVIDFSFFYNAKSGQRTYKILVEHSGVVVNYGEVSRDSFKRTGLKVGSPVRAGQVIGYVSDTKMLHFETYKRGTKSAYRWWKGESPPPRLLDPTRYLLHLAKYGAGAPSTSVQREASPVKGAKSPLVGEERTPAVLTQIVKVPLRAASTPEWRQWSAVYFPPAVNRNSRTIDVILYLHGHRTAIPGARRSIWAYLKHQCWPLREHLAASGKAAVLIAPTLDPWSKAPVLLKQGGLDRYLDAVLAATASYWSSGTAPAIRHIILAGHSGAGVLMRVLARSGNRYAALIKEVWGFDSTYSKDKDVDSTGWAAWAKAHPQSRLFIYYLRGTKTQDQAEKLRKRALPNVSVIASNAKARERIHAHFWVPIQHWGERIAASPHLRR